MNSSKKTFRIFWIIIFITFISIIINFPNQLPIKINLGKDIKEIEKVGFLLNFHVYLDPRDTDNNIIMSKNDENPINIKVIF